MQLLRSCQQCALPCVVQWWNAGLRSGDVCMVDVKTSICSSSATTARRDRSPSTVVARSLQSPWAPTTRQRFFSSVDGRRRRRRRPAGTPSHSASVQSSPSFPVRSNRLTIVRCDSAERVQVSCKAVDAVTCPFTLRRPAEPTVGSCEHAVIEQCDRWHIWYTVRRGGDRMGEHVSSYQPTHSVVTSCNSIRHYR